MGSVVGLTGGYICLNVGLYGYIGDVTSSESRTARMSVLNGVFSLGYVVGNILGGQLYKVNPDTISVFFCEFQYNDFPYCKAMTYGVAILHS